MKSLLKWFIIIGGVLFTLIITAAFIIPQFIDTKKYKPIIERKVAQATGRSFTFGDDIDVSVFPWVGVKLTDLHFGNPKMFQDKDMVSVESFEVRLKVIPLLSRKIEVKTFVLDSPKIYLEKLKDGRANWQGIGAKHGGIKEKQEQKGRSVQDRRLPIQGLKVGSFSITNGQLIYRDQSTKYEKAVTDMRLNLTNISLDSPFGIKFGARIDGKPISLEGKAGPIGKEPGKGTIAMDLVLKALDVLHVKLNGSVIDPATSRIIDLKIDIASFSPRKLMASLNLDFPIKTGDPMVLDAVAFKAHLKGNKNSISFFDGVLNLDDSNLGFTATAKEFDKPNLEFDLQLDQIDLDRYLPDPPPEKASSHKNRDTEDTEKKKTDYDPLRNLLADGKIMVGEVKVKGAIVEDIVVHIMAENGIITMDPLDMKLYQGSVASSVKLNVQQNDPAANVNLDVIGIQVAPLIKDTVDKELIEGAMKANLKLSMKGDALDIIKKSLNGQGQILFTDGAIFGIDLADSVRNVQTRLGIGEKPKEKLRTDFAELEIPFTVNNGIVNTIATHLVSPLIRVITAGDIDLVQELLNLRIEPKFVATLKGQGDAKERSGLMVPVLVTGNFTSPKIRPDLKRMLSVGEVPLNAGELKKQVLGSGKEYGKLALPDKKQAPKKVTGLLEGFTN